jgi:hypothetical protein
LWQWNFFSGVFKDIDTILTIQTYWKEFKVWLLKVDTNWLI